VLFFKVSRVRINDLRFFGCLFLLFQDFVDEGVDAEPERGLDNRAGRYIEGECGIGTNRKENHDDGQDPFHNFAHLRGVDAGDCAVGLGVARFADAVTDFGGFCGVGGLFLLHCGHIYAGGKVHRDSGGDNQQEKAVPAVFVFF